MSERLTEIHLPGVRGGGIGAYGRQTPAEMVRQLREKAAHDKTTAEAILAAPDDAFRVVTFVGLHARRNREILQEGRNGK